MVITLIMEGGVVWVITHPLQLHFGEWGDQRLAQIKRIWSTAATPPACRFIFLMKMNCLSWGAVPGSEIWDGNYIIREPITKDGFLWLILTGIISRDFRFSGLSMIPPISLISICRHKRPGVASRFYQDIWAKPFSPFLWIRWKPPLVLLTSRNRVLPIIILM